MSFLNPYMTAIKLGGVGLAVLALVCLIFSWMGRGAEIESLKEWRSAVVISTTDATVLPDKAGKRKLLDPASVLAAIAGLKRSWDSCQTASETRSQIAAEQKRRADNADAALANVQTIMRGEFSSAQKRIEALQRVKAAPTPELQCQGVAADSKSAWEGWR